jgi:hypothetical protein
MMGMREFEQLSQAANWRKNIVINHLKVVFYVQKGNTPGTIAV